MIGKRKALGEINTLFKQALSHYQQGHLAAAGKLTEKILVKDPNHADANCLSGIIASQRGQYNLAAQRIAHAIRCNPGQPMYFNNYGLALRMAGRLDEALSAFDHAIALNPQYAEAHGNRGVALSDLGRLEESLAACEQAIRIMPQYAVAHAHRGFVLAELGRFDAAVTASERALQLNPHLAAAHNNLGNALHEVGRLEEALAACEQAIRINPEYAEAHGNRGYILSDLCRMEEAVTAGKRAICLNPDLAWVHSNLGNTLQEQGRLEAAERSFRHALELQPDNAILHSGLLFLLAARVRLSAEGMIEELQNWDNIHGREGRMNTLTTRVGQASDERRLRIGYVSPDLRTHSVSHFFEPLLSAHDRTRFEVFCYDANPDCADGTTERLRRVAEHWQMVASDTDGELAGRIHEDGIDILVDLSGHTRGNRLKAFTYRPSPVQASYLGFFATTGIEAMDYWITDEILHPPDTQEKTVEQIYRLPRCWVCYQPGATTPGVEPCPNTGDKVVFGSFSNLSKLTPEVIETWSRLLHQLPGSHLLLMAKSLSDSGTRRRLADRFAQWDIDPEQLTMRGGASHDQYLRTYAEVDIVLDPFPRTGGTTTAESLWMGVPVVTLAGQRYVERISASKLTAIGLEDLVAGSRENYLDKAVSLAHNPNRRKALRASLRKKMAASPLCNAKDLAQAMESAYQSMWNRYKSTKQ